jgi:putative hydrolase of the HAD superfamily
MKPTEALILDFGGVLYAIDYDAPVRAFAALGATDFAALYHKASQTPLMDALETGHLPPADFLLALQAYCAPGTTLHAVESAWNSILLGLQPWTRTLLPKLAQSYRLFLFSNTNALHTEAFLSQLRTTGDWDLFTTHFEAIHFSHELGLRKPDTTAFTHLCRLHHLDLARTTFVDDSPQHVAGAQAAGLRALWFQDLTPAGAAQFWGGLGV